MNFKFVYYGLNFILLLVCVFHIVQIFIGILNPDLPEVKIVDKQLKDIEFPFLFKICVDDLSMKKFKSMGYMNDWDYFLGRSMFNSNIYGWNGHTDKGLNIGSVEGKFKGF